MRPPEVQKGGGWRKGRKEARNEREKKRKKGGRGNTV